MAKSSDDLNQTIHDIITDEVARGVDEFDHHVDVPLEVIGDLLRQNGNLDDELFFELNVGLISKFLHEKKTSMDFTTSLASLGPLMR